jgi:predicted transcriptional regulator
VDGVQISTVNLTQLNIGDQTITARIGVKENAKNLGGICLFGSRFGNHPQDIILKLTYQQS